MTIRSGSKIIRTGLVMDIDTGSTRSYLGPSILNKAPGLTAQTGSGTGYAVTSGTETVYIPSLGSVPTTYVNLYNNYPGGGGSYALAPFYFGNPSVSSSTLYTYSIVYKAESGYTHANYLYRYEYTSTPTYIVEAGIFNTSNRVHLGNDWYWAWGTFTTQATAASLILYFYQYRYGTATEKTSIAKVFLAQGDYSGLHPKYWPGYSTTRSATASVIDTTGNTIPDVTNCAYTSSGELSFNGSTTMLISPNSTALNNQTITIESWCKPTLIAQNGFLFEKGTVNTQYSNFFNYTNTTFYFRTTGLSSTDLTFSTASISTTQYSHIVSTYTSGVKTIYVNGVQAAQATGLTGTISTNGGGQSIGVYGGYSGSRGYYFNGYIPVTRIYSVGLTQSEVQNNFNALRGRFGV